MVPKLNKSARLDADWQEIPEDGDMAVEDEVTAEEMGVEGEEDAPFNRPTSCE